MLKLVIEDDEGNKTVVPVIRDEISIGRQEGNTIRLTERNVSRRHAKLVRDDEDIFVEEISSRYGTKKNGEKIEERARFDVGDVFLIGDYRLTLESEGKDVKPNGAAPVPEITEPKKNGFTSAPTQITRTEDLERRASQGTEILPAAPAKIVVISSNFAGQEFPLNRKEMVIGRADECDIIIDHRSVSQTHAKIVREPSGTYKIVDLNSKNGVKVSGEQYRAVHLKRGDVIEMGHVKFRFVEPGENYVFTPPAAGSDDFEAAPTKSGGNGLLIGGILVVALIAVGVGYVVMNNNPTDNTAVVSEKSNAKTDEPKTDTKVKADAPDSWVTDQVAKAESELKNGKPERAIVLLEATRDYPSASPKQREAIDALLSTARRERPLEKQLELGRASFDGGDFVKALTHFKKIPPDEDSAIYGILKKDDLANKAMSQILSQARAASEDGDQEEAANLVEEVLFYDSSHAGAAALKEEFETKKTAVAAKAVTKTKSTSPKKRPPKKDINTILEEAQAKLYAGKENEAIALCKGVRNAKCYRILGVAYKKKGDIEKSCKYFKRAGMEPGHCK